MANTIKFKRGSGSDPGTSDLSVGEIAIRTDTAKLFTKNDAGSVVSVSGGVDDGDKGDITVSNSGATFTIDDDAVTYAKIQNVSATNRILGRDSSGAGAIEEITPANLRTMLNVEDGATADQSASEIVALIADQTIAPSTIDMEDNEKIKLGISDDLEIFHDGSNSRIKDVGTGVLALSGSEVHVQNNNNSQSIAKFLGDTTNSRVELYANDSKTFETLSGGNAFTGYLFATDNAKLILGASNDLELFHDGSHSKITNDTGFLVTASNQFKLSNKAEDHTYINIPTNGGGVELYEDNIKRFETTSSGCTVTGSLDVGTITGTTNFTADITTTGLNIGSVASGATAFGQDKLDIREGGIHLNSQSTATSGALSSKISFLKLHPSAPSVNYEQGRIEAYTENGFGAGGLDFYSGKLVGGGNYAITKAFRIDHNQHIVPAVDSTHDIGTSSNRFANGYFDTLYGDGSNITGLASGGKVLQVVYANISDQVGSSVTTSSGSFQNTGVSVSITPSSSSNKILVKASGTVNNSSSGAGGGITIFRGSTNIAPSGDMMAGFFGEDNSNNIENSAIAEILDSPNTTSATTYSIRFRAFSGTMRFGQRQSGRIVAMEIAA